MSRPLPHGFGAAVWAASLLFSASAAAKPALPSSTTNNRSIPMQTGTDGYGMVFHFRTGEACRLEMVFDGPELVRHLPYLQINNMVSKTLTPIMVAQEPDVLAMALGQRATATGLPGLVKAPGTTSCDVLFQTVHTPLSRDGLHTLLFFRISSAQALTFHDHVPGITEVRAKAVLYVMSADDMLGIVRETGNAQTANDEQAH